jgi:hypothetical protein
MFSFCVFASHIVNSECLLTMECFSESNAFLTIVFLILVLGAGWFVDESRIEIGHKSRN